MKRIRGIFLSILMCVTMLSGCALGVPRPAIQKSEFAFSVTYEYQGETNTIDGVFVCEYDGLVWSLDGGWDREWKGYIKDGTSEETILLGVAEDGGQVELTLHFYPYHFMGDSHYADDEPFAPWMYVRMQDEEGLWFENEPDYIAEHYGAKIIDYTYDAPIENTFK